MRDETGLDVRIQRMFERALGRPPTDTELGQSRAYLAELSSEHQTEAAALLRDQRVWRDFAHSLFNLKELIFIQ